jgi:hypothetical protein
MFPLWKITHIFRSPLSSLSIGLYPRSKKLLKKPQKQIMCQTFANATVTETLAPVVLLFCLPVSVQYTIQFWGKKIYTQVRQNGQTSEKNHSKSLNL